MFTFNQINKAFNNIANAHKQINSYGMGDVFEIATSGSIRYPMMWAQPQDSTYEINTYISSWKIFLFDLVHKDESNENDVMSDMEQIGIDVISILRSPLYEFNFTADSITFERFTERFYDEVTGIAFVVNLEVPAPTDRCAVPSTVIDTGSSIEIVTIYDSNGDVVAQVQAPGSYTIPDAGDVDYIRSTPMEIAVGGAEIGTTFNGTIQDALDEILYPFVAPTFTSFSISQSSPVEIGDTISGSKTFTWATSQSANVSTNTISILDVTNSVTLASSLANDGTESVNIGSVQKTTVTSHSWRATAIDTQLNVFQSSLTTVNWYYRLFYGTSTNTTLTESQIEALLNNPLSSGFSGTYSFASGGYKYFSWPDSFGSPTASTGFKDTSTNLAVDMATVSDNAAYSNVSNGWYYALVSVTNSFSINTNYRVYRTKNILGSTINIQVS